MPSAYILGGGPGLKQFNLSSLSAEQRAGHTVIAVNRSWEIYPEADIFFSADGRFVTHYKDQMQFEGRKIYCQTNLDLPGWEIVPMEDHCMNSGFLAMRYAVEHGFYPIYVIGMDCQGPYNIVNGEIPPEDNWWHNGYPWKSQQMHPTVRQRVAGWEHRDKVIALTPTTMSVRGPNFKVVSFYTEKYKHLVANLEESVRFLGLEYSIRELPDAGSWLKNVNQKARFLLDELRETDLNLVWVDIDAVFYRRPDLFYDLKVFAHGDKHGEVLTGTLFVPNKDDETEELLLRWAQQPPLFWDQVLLKQVLTDFRHESLPQEYCHIFDDPIDVSPVIEHYQASRQLKDMSWVRGRS